MPIALPARWFRMEPAQVHAAVYLILSLYKLGIWLLFLAPWLALRIVFSGGTP